MSRLQSIENALMAINETAFQELGDHLLTRRNNNYAAFSRIGSQVGKQKTTKGTPDSLLLLPNGKYILIEYSTNVTKGVKKIKEDIVKCLDSSKTGIPHGQISEIIICLNFKLKPDELIQIRELIANTRIALSLYDLPAIALELQFNHRDLCHTYLGLPLDTGQIVTIDDFITEYNNASKGIATPLDNVFLHREQEIKDLYSAITNYDFVILTGSPGIGKTKLALETIKIFLKENIDYGAYCVSYKNHTLLDDLYQYFKTDKDYILFVDDANRIDAFGQITGFFKAKRKGKLKIIITVRDYAFNEIGLLCQEFHTHRILINKLTDQQIIDIIKSDSFQILNPDYQKEIIRIADGNPRIAIMTALLAKAKQNIYALSDVSDLFEKYFSTFTKDDGEFAKSFNLKVLGLISFFYTLPYKNKEAIEGILTDFDIKYDNFIDCIDKLDSLELVDVQFEHVKVPEQNLATFFFYKCFIKDELLSFETLLAKYFESNYRRFSDCVIPANNTFGPKNVMEKLQPQLKKHWGTIKTEDSKAIKFLNTFWYYLPQETQEFVYSRIKSKPIIDVSEFDLKYENNSFSYDKDEIIELIGEFFRSSLELKNALTLSLEYVKRNPEKASELVHKIRETLVFDIDDERNDFERQKQLYELLNSNVKKGDLLSIALFFELSKTFLNFSFRQTKGGRNHSFYFYEYKLPPVETIKFFRKSIWESVSLIYDKYDNLAFNLLEDYGSRSPDVVKEIMQYDLPFVLEIIKSKLSNSNFEHCRYVQEQIRWFKANKIQSDEFDNLCSKFTNDVYEIFLKLDWDRYRDKESFEFNDHREYEKLKENEIRNSFVFKNEAEIESFYSSFVYLKVHAKNDWNYNTSLDYIIDENAKHDFQIAEGIFKCIIKNNNEIKYVPRLLFRNFLNTTENVKIIWDWFHSSIFQSQTQWELSFYAFIDDSCVKEFNVESILKTVKTIEEPILIQFDSLEKFLVLKPDLFKNILQLIVDKIDTTGLRIQLWMDFFTNQFDKLGDDIGLIEKAYLQQYSIQSHFDYEGKGFLNILNKDLGFLNSYVDKMVGDAKFGLPSGDHARLGFIWTIKGIENELEKLFDRLISKDFYHGILEHFFNVFFRGIAEEQKNRADQFILSYVTKYFSDTKKMNAIVDITRHSMRHLYEKVLLLYLSLIQDEKEFGKIHWRGSGTSGVGDVILADIEAADWKNILSIIESSDLGISVIPIKRYLEDKVQSCLRSGDWERQRRFMERY